MVRFLVHFWLNYFFYVAAYVTPHTYEIDLSMNPNVVAFSMSVRTLAQSRPAGTSASIYIFNVTSLPWIVVNCSIIASTTWCISRAGLSAEIMTVPTKRVGNFSTTSFSVSPSFVSGPGSGPSAAGYVAPLGSVASVQGLGL